MLLPVYKRKKGSKKSGKMGMVAAPSSIKWRSYLRIIPCIMGVYLLIYISIGPEDDESMKQSMIPRDVEHELFYDIRIKNASLDKGHTHAPELSKKHPHIVFREHRVHETRMTQFPQPDVPPGNAEASNARNMDRPGLLTANPAKSHQFVNPHDFNYKINNPFTCKEENIFILIFVHSSPDHFESRDIIRKSWASIIQYGDFNIRTIFMLAKTKDRIIQWKLEEESQLNEDIIQEDFMDHYKNLTYKHIMSLKWIKDYCPHAQYIVKVDDDTFVNIFRLTDYLDEKYYKEPMDNSIYCSVFSNQGPRRDKTDKWYVSLEEYPHDKYPPYCEGFAYIMSPDLVSKLYSASLWTKYYWIDDVYVTGFLTNQIGAKLKNFRGTNGYSIMSSKHYHKEDVNSAIFLLAKYNKDNKMWMKIWSATKKYSLQRTITIRSVSEFAKFGNF